MTKITKEENIERLIEIKDEIKELLNEAADLVKETDSNTWEEARAYWYAHILGALDKDNDFLGGSMTNMEDTIEELNGQVE